MKLSKLIKEEWLQIVILLVPFVIVAFKWNDFPDRIPIHFNGHGDPNGFSSKVLGLLLLPLINIATAIGISKLSRFDPKAALDASSYSTLKKVRLTVTCFLFLLFLAIIGFSLGMNVDMQVLPRYGVMIFFLIFGNFLPKIRPNYFVGVRTPWTLEDTENWKYTHQFAGKVWVVASIAALIIEVLIPSQPVFYLYITLIIVAPILYSFVFFERRKKKILENK